VRVLAGEHTPVSRNILIFQIVTQSRWSFDCSVAGAVASRKHDARATKLRKIRIHGIPVKGKQHMVAGVVDV